MRTCTACGHEKPLHEFHFEPSKGRHRANCRECQRSRSREGSRAHYQANKGRYFDRNKAARARILAWVQQYKTDHATCADCGLPHPPWRLQFDHLGDKLFNVSDGYQKGLKKVQEEIAKCEIVCANCHADRTHYRKTCTPEGTRTPALPTPYAGCSTS